LGMDCYWRKAKHYNDTWSFFGNYCYILSYNSYTILFERINFFSFKILNPKTAREAEADEFGRKLNGFGINLLVSDVLASVNFPREVLQMKVHHDNQDFKMVQSGRTYFQLHADHTYHSNPLPSLLPRDGARGAGIELRIYEIDPDKCEVRASELDFVILKKSEDRPHGLRECYILDNDDYCWVPSRTAQIKPDLSRSKQKLEGLFPSSPQVSKSFGE